MTVGGSRSTAQIQRAGLSGPVDRPDTESKALWSGRPTGRPALCLPNVHKAVHVSRPLRSTGPWFGRPHGRPYQGPVDPAVDRRAQPCARLAAQWAGRPTGRPDQRALLSVSGRSAVRSTGCPNGHNYDRWRSTGPVDRKPVRLPDQPNG